MSETRPLIAKTLSRAFSGRTVVDQVSLALEPGQVTSLIGPSGSGKTTLLRLLAGMERQDTGSVASGAELLSGDGTFVPIEKRRIGLVFQDFALFPHLSVLGNVMFGLRALPKSDRQRQAETWIDRLGLSHRRDAFPHHLSGGEQQRTAIARALAPEPVAILLDEPFSGLDPAMRDQVRSAALDAVRAANIPALLVTHDASEALVHSDQVAVINAGRILQVDTPERIYKQPNNLAVARALGPLHQLPLKTLPTAWQAALGARATPLWYRPEAIQIGAGAPLPVVSVRLAGAVTEIRLRVSENETVFATCQPTHAVQPGDTVDVSLNPELVFEFAE